ncbi:MAG TPA: hypothetical protein VKY74_09055, partial [Chloroflexia bacterium]|nr:hypothetical protein [Chloroflexia bacterium]
LHGFLLAAPLIACAAIRSPGPLVPAARALAILTGVYIFLHLVIISILSGLGPISRYEWGQRYLLPAYPLLIALAVTALARFWPAGRVVSRQSSVVSHESVGSRPYAVGRDDEDGGPEPDSSGPPSPIQNPKSKIQNPAVQNPKSKIAVLVLAVLLAGTGAGFLGRGWGVVRESTEQARQWQAAVAAAPDRVLVTDSWWVPLVLAPSFYAHTWLLAPGPAAAAAWPAQARQGGLPGFSTVTLRPALGAGMPHATPPARPGGATTWAGLTIQHFDLPRVQLSGSGESRRSR